MSDTPASTSSTPADAPAIPPTPLAPASTHRQQFRRPGERAWLRVGAAATEASVVLNGQTVGLHLGAWTPFEFEITPWLRDENELLIHCRDRVHTTNGFLPTIGIRWTGARDVRIQTTPTPSRPPARQRSATRGTQLLVDGRPFRVRGVLHWGYYPELGNPWPDRDTIRREILHVRSLGFNLIKFCLWIPPPAYYELCEELGMFVWQEYPVWNTPLAGEGVLREFADFFRNDAPFSCVILRTMTCENDRVSAETARRLVDLCHEMIPGSLALDNSGWLCSERYGDFHDEHPYLNNMEWSFYGRRMRPLLTRPLLLGETLYTVSPAEGPYDISLAKRRFQIETLARDLPDAGYVQNVMRDIRGLGSGLCRIDGTPKFTPAQWEWHREPLAPPRVVPPVRGTIVGPRKGGWKCPNHWWFSTILRFHDHTLPRELIERELYFELLSGRVLSHAQGTRVLLELDALTGNKRELHPLIIEFTTQGQRRVVSAFRSDTPAGRQLADILASRTGDAPEIGPLVGTSILLEDWQMSVDGERWIDVKADTALVNGGRNIFEGWARFRTTFDYPGGPRTLRCETVGDYFECLIDGVFVGEAGPRNATWDGTRDVPREFAVDLSPGRHEIEFFVRDWRGGGGMIGPVFFAGDLTERVY